MRSLGLSLFVSLCVLLFSAPLFASSGEATYNKSCKMCHASGAAGAPAVGKKKDWQARIEKGLAELEKNAIKGFRGYRGYMPPKGGNPKLSDEDVKAAVDFMLSSSQ